jgi:colanic acid/amylovoran biosynthesis glycosyltransferase
MERTLYLFTDSFPYGNTSEVPFLKNEIRYLNNKFQKIVLVPYHHQPDSALITDQYPVDFSLLKNKIKKTNYARMMLNSLKRDVITDFVKLSQAGELAKRERLIRCVNRASAVSEWVSKKIGFNARALFYTYWFTDITTGLCFARNNGAKIPIVSRAHGYDLYPERNQLRYFPLRSYALRFIDRLFLISEDGYQYMCSAFPIYRDKYEISRLGVLDQEDWSFPSQNDKTLSIVSCAYLSPLKRIGLLCDAISNLGLKQPDWSIRWDHFGGGNSENFEAIRSKINGNTPNVKINLWGNVTNNIILDHYKNNPVDIFMSVSESEGIPMSMMEAMSFGIPVISTDVGGTNELVSNHCGLLLPKDITADQIANAIEGFIKEKKNVTLRQEAKETCQKSYSARQNYTNFAEKIADR